MITEYDDLVWVGAVNDTDGVPYCSVVLFHDIGKGKTRARAYARAVIDAWDCANPSCTIDLLATSTVAVQCLQKWLGFQPGNRQRRNIGQIGACVRARGIFLGRISRRGGISRVGAKELHTPSLH